MSRKLRGCCSKCKVDCKVCGDTGIEPFAGDSAIGMPCIACDAHKDCDTDPCDDCKQPSFRNIRKVLIQILLDREIESHAFELLQKLLAQENP